MLDSWRETDGVDPTADVASSIEDAHSGLLELLYDADLDGQFLLGNHGYDLYRSPNYDTWRRQFWLPSAVVLHLAAFDWLEELPDRWQNLMVHCFSPVANPGRPRFNVQDAQSPPAMLKYLNAAWAKCREADPSLTTAVIGHTHHARIAVREDGDELFALVDCGAWMEDCITDAMTRRPAPMPRSPPSAPTRFGSINWRRGPGLAGNTL